MSQKVFIKRAFEYTSLTHFLGDDRLSIANHSKAMVSKERSPLTTAKLFGVKPSVYEDSYYGAKSLGSVNLYLIS
jgi:hypothetical protein